MTRLPLIRGLAILFAALFLLGQGLAQAHDAEHGLGHSHDGVPCAVSVLGEDKAELTVPPSLDAPVVDHGPDITPRPTPLATFHDARTCRAPPPRAPPNPASRHQPC
ncbi:hypothetical protein [uncultured Algimonas sp.]|uniref:hypothetical protein n=1 Tax=uncultured Algimonas sp. TaxID=1547920 RepID=UPI0026114568|nr:hypothetical protein [uncultured Algimonas sp.]